MHTSHITGPQLLAPAFNPQFNLLVRHFFYFQSTVGLKLAVETVTEVLVFYGNPMQPVVEALLAHFFSSHRPSYHKEDVLWFLKWANKQKHWCDSASKSNEEVLDSTLL